MLLIAAFILSACEVAFYSLTSAQEKLEGKIYSLLKSPQLLLSTILVSNAIAVFLFSLLAASLAVDVASHFSISKTLVITAEVIVASGLLILFADTIPKIIASRNPRGIAKATLPILTLLLLVESPVVLPLNSFLSRISRKRKKTSLSIDDGGLKTLAELAASAKVMDENEARLLNKIAFLGEKTVRNAMTPRAQITSISEEAHFNEVLDVLKRHEHSRVLVYSRAPENIVGILYARDFLPVFRRKSARKTFRIGGLMRKPVFVPETQSIEQLIETFRENRVHIAVVVDEFGGLAGIVTLSDVVREIFGSSAEGPREGERIKRLSDSVFLVKGLARLDEVAAEVDGFNVGQMPGETVSALLTELEGHVPRLGSRLNVGNFEFEVVQATPKNVVQVRIHRVNSQPDSANEE